MHYRLLEVICSRPLACVLSHRRNLGTVACGYAEEHQIEMVPQNRAQRQEAPVRSNALDVAGCDAKLCMVPAIAR